MFEEYLQDSNEFLSIAVKLAKEANARGARRYFRASIFYASGAMEAFVNYIGDSFAKAGSIPVQEIAFLNDKSWVFSKNKGLVERPSYNRLEDKLRFLLDKFVKGFDFQGLSWNKLMEFKDLRDSLVHPREMEDERALADYQKQVASGLKAIIEIINQILTGMSGKPLRKQILDLIPE